MILALLFSFAMADEPIIEWKGQTGTGHHVLYVTVDGQEHVYPVDPEDFNDEEAMAMMVDDVVKDVSYEEIQVFEDQRSPQR